MDYPETVGKKLQVYMNIRKKKQGAPFWSLRDKKTGRVVGHEGGLILENCTFTVQPAGQAKVRKTNRKNVHAWITGTRVEAGPLDILQQYGLCPSLRPKVHAITYNPYKHEGFVLRDFSSTEEELITWARKVLFHPSGSLYVFAPLSEEWVR